jgi:hypothetical protein
VGVGGGGGGRELHTKELCVYYPNMLAELEFSHYINSIQYCNYRNAVDLSGLTLQSLLATFCTAKFSIKKFLRSLRGLHLCFTWMLEQTVILFLYSLN